MRLSKSRSYQAFISKQGLALTLLAVLISLSSALLAYFEATKELDWLLYDNAMKMSQLAASDDIVIIDIDDKSLNQIGRWPWPRSTHAALLNTLSQTDTQMVVFDVLFPELDTGNYAADVSFAQAIKRHGKVILPIYLETLGQQGQVIESPPHSLFYQEVKALGHVHLPVESDGVVRSVYLKEGVGSAYWPHLSLALLKNLHEGSKAQGDDSIPGKQASRDKAHSPNVGIARDFYNLLPMPAPEQGLRHFSYSDVLNGSVDLANLDNKIVFIGATAAGLGDVLATPLGSMSGVELNAWVFQGLRHNQLIQPLPSLSVVLMTFLLVLCFVLILGRLSPRLFLVCSLFSLVGVLVTAMSLLLLKHVWLPPASILLGIVAFFPLWSWLRAESILRFLREEIADLSATTRLKKIQQNRQLTAQHFLEQTGMLDSVAQATQKGERAVSALCSGHPLRPSQDFWQQQLTQHQSHTTLEPHSYKGIEVIARTISQLSEIKENDKKNRQLIEQSLSRLQDAVCITDLCGEITFTNKRFEAWFQGENQAETILDTLSTLELKSGWSWSQVLSEVFQTNKLFTDEATLSDTPDKQFLCQASLVSINEAHLDTLILTFTDISQLKAAENARSEALSFLSHDLRSPMVSVLAILQRYHAENAKGDRHLSGDSIQHIESLVRKNLDYAESFLQLSKADALLNTHMSPCDLHAVLDAAQAQAMSLAAPKSIHVTTERCDDDVWVLGDMRLLERALTNLISNAVKFSPTGSQLNLTLLKHGQEAQLSVEDQGPGIERKDQTSIFERFTRLKQSDETEGAGLGLNFVATVALKHQGRVALDSKLGAGSTFSLCLPVLSEEELFEFD